ncbi:hypothetical protein [Saccharopolyspora gloriosae]|uniref:hypothetical protein n=1 Tax=Saccharopolyspora gloriosae TaxID=455344 RepID=UPI001FB67DEE|nr:hypothetical protein [Saccharopolyspora gloriosae]
MKTPLWTVLAALLLSSCGDAPRTLVEPDVRAELMASVSEVDEAARRHDRVGSEFALADLVRNIAAAQSEGRLDPTYARSLLAVVDRVAADVATLPLPGPPPPTVVSVPGNPLVPPPGSVTTLPGKTVTVPPEVALPPGPAEKRELSPGLEQGRGSPPSNDQNGQSGNNVGDDQSENGNGSQNGKGNSNSG